MIARSRLTSFGSGGSRRWRFIRAGGRSTSWGVLYTTLCERASIRRNAELTSPELARRRPCSAAYYPDFF